MQTEAKRLMIAVPGAEEDSYYKVLLFPGMTVIDIQDQLPALRDFDFFRGHNTLPIKKNVDLYPSARDGDLIFASTYQDVGFLGSLTSLFSRKGSRPAQPKESLPNQITKAQKSLPSSNQSKRGSKSLPAHQAGQPNSAPGNFPANRLRPLKGKPLWKVLGWKKEGESYKGVYRFKKRSWLGLIEKRFNRFRVYIWAPPKELRNHKKWVCFNKKGKKKYRVHFKSDISEVSQAIINVQRLLAEAIIFHGQGR